YGMLGAAYATLAATILLMVVRTWNAQRVYRVAYQWRRVVVLLLAAGALTGIGQALPHSLVLAFALTAAYPLLLATVGFYLPAQRKRLRRLLPAHNDTRADVWEGHGRGRRGRMGERPRGDSVARTAGSAGAGGRPPSGRARPPLALRRGAPRSRPTGRRGRLHRGTACNCRGDRRRPPSLSDPRRAPERDRPPRRPAR